MDKTMGGYLQGTVSVIVNTILFVLKIWVSIITGSIALAADAWHTMSDSLSSIMVIISTKLSSRKADKEHPFGHGRWELIASLFIAMILGIIAYDFVRNSIFQWQHKQGVTYGIIAIIVTIFSIVVKEFLAQYAFYIAKKTANSSVRADGWHHRSDALSSAVVLVGILFARQFWWIDSLLGVIVGLMLFYAIFQILKEVISKILGEEPTPELVHSISGAISQKYGSDLMIHHLHLHDYIVHKEITMHIRLHKDLSFEQAHHIATDLEKIIDKEFNMDATIHIEPLDE